MQNQGKLDLDFSLVEEARVSARKIAEEMQTFIDRHSTVSVERTVCRLLGIDGINEFDVPLPNVVVDNIQKGNGLTLGAALYLGNAILETGWSTQKIAEENRIKMTDSPILQ